MKSVLGAFSAFFMPYLMYHIYCKMCSFLCHNAKKGLKKKLALSVLCYDELVNNLSVKWSKLHCGTKQNQKSIS